MADQTTMEVPSACDICMAPHDMYCIQCTYHVCLHCFYKWNNGCPQCRLENWAVQDLSIIQTIDLTFE